jgi:hypothetical protein
MAGPSPAPELRPTARFPLDPPDGGDNPGKRWVPENVVAYIVGHEKAMMTYGPYAGGVSLAVKRDALAKPAYCNET